MNKTPPESIICPVCGNKAYQVGDKVVCRHCRPVPTPEAKPKKTSRTASRQSSVPEVNINWLKAGFLFGIGFLLASLAMSIPLAIAASILSAIANAR